MLTESLLIAMLGAVIGVAGAFYATDYLNFAKANLTNPLPHWMVFTLDFKVLAFVVLVTLLAALVAGFVPAWMASRASTAQVLKESGRGNTGRTVGVITRGLVVFQIMVTSILLIGAMLELQSIHRQQTIDHGYDTRSLLSARLGLMQTDYPTLAAKRTFYERLLRELRATPEFASAAITSRNRMALATSTRIEIEGRQYMSDSDRPAAIFENISSGYFEVLGLALREGRDFSEADQDQRDPVAIVNAAFAQAHFGNESPLGRRFRTVQGARDSFGPWRTIVGVIGDLRMQGPLDRESDGSGFFTPFSTNAANFSTIVVRPREGQRPQGLGPAVQATTSRVDPNLPLYYFLTPEDAIAGFLTQNRFIAVMFGAFGLVAVILASIGLYGIMSFSVNQRLQEFGIRMALGADRSRIFGLVFRQGATQVAFGLALGLGCSLLFTFFAADLLQGALFDVSPRDPLTYLGVAGLLIAVSVLAMLVPARRATNVDPMIALRAE
jgi:predicted permease